MTTQILSSNPRTRRTWSAEERAEWVELFEKSGQTAVEFCRDNDLTPTTLAFWPAQLKDSAGLENLAEDLEEAALVEVPLSALNAGSARSSTAAVTIRLNSGTQLEVLAGTDPAWLSQLLAALKG